MLKIDKYRQRNDKNGILSPFYLANFATAAILALTGCYNESPKLLAQAPLGLRKAQSETQVLSAKVDVLFVIDDSGSMSGHQTNLTRNVDLFLDGLKKTKYVDYHIGVVTSSETESTWSRGAVAGKLNGAIKYVDRSTPNQFDVLKKNMLVGTGGENEERMFSPTYLALTEPNLSGHNAGFYRPSALLALVFITDTDDQSDIQPGYTPRPTHPLYFKPDKFISWLYSLKPNGRQKIFTYGAAIIDIPESVCMWGYPIPPSKHDNLKEFFMKTKATVHSLCDPNYGQKLAEIGEDLVKRINQGMVLDRRPDPETIRVTYGVQEIPSHAHRGWFYLPESNSIRFGPNVEWLEQPGDPKLEVTFEPRSN